METPFDLSAKFQIHTVSRVTMFGKDSESDPLRIWFIDTNEVGQIATTLGIGKKQKYPQSGRRNGLQEWYWNRDLETDLTQIKLLEAYRSKMNKHVTLKGNLWNRKPITTIISILERDELQELEIEELEQGSVEKMGFDWIWINSWPDGMAPKSEEFLRRWSEVKGGITRSIIDGDNVLIHCKGGLSRTGALSAMILNELGSPIEEAISKVREARERPEFTNEKLIEPPQVKWLKRNFS
jgi:protein-tyrosine phosphatase